jgi:hypothetical protein
LTPSIGIGQALKHSGGAPPLEAVVEAGKAGKAGKARKGAKTRRRGEETGEEEGVRVF